MVFLHYVFRIQLHSAGAVHVRTLLCNIACQACFKEGCLFDDVLKMGRQTAYCHRREANTRIPDDLDILVAGFSCKSVSALNMTTKDIRDTSSSTGSTLKGVLKYLSNHRPKLALLENVKGILQ